MQKEEEVDRRRSGITIPKDEQNRTFTGTTREAEDRNM